MASNESSAGGAENNDKSKKPENYMVPTVGDGDITFPLRDGVYVSITMRGKSIGTAFVWQGENFCAPDTGDFFSKPFRERLIGAVEAAFGDAAPNVAEDIHHVAAILRAPRKGGGNLMDEVQEASERSTMDRLVAYARAAATFFHNSEKEGFATIKKDEHLENYEINSRDFKHWLRHEFWSREKQRLEAAAAASAGDLGEGMIRAEMPTVVRDRDLSDALLQIKSLARFEGAEVEVHIRTAAHDGKVYVDMGDEAWRAIEISPLAWRIVEGEDVPVRFIRPKGLLALPEPVPSGEGTLDGLLDLLNLGDGKEGKRNRILILAWLSHAYLPTGPYPVLTLTGPQGAAKSHALRILRSLVDPSRAPGSTKPRSEHDAYIDASANWVIAYDNLPTVPPWLSNVLCDLATGGGFRTRQLYTNRDQEIFADCRPIILAGIGSVATRADLLDRAALVNLPRIDPKARRKEAVINRRLSEVQPEILSALLDAVAVGLAKKDTVNLDELPRMADFAVWGIATEGILGAEPGEFMAAYAGSRQDASDTALEAWAPSDTFIEFAHRFVGEENAWEGTASELLSKLNNDAQDEDLKRAKEWPKSASSLSGQLGALIPDLLEVGISVTSRRNMKKRVLRVFVTPDK